MKFPFFGGGQPKITGSTLVGITEQGKKEAGQYASRGSEFDVLSPLYERSPQSVSTLMAETGMSFKDIEKNIKALSPHYIVIMQREG